MKPFSSKAVAVTLGLFGAALAASASVAAQLVLITADEAKLPPPKDAIESSRAVTRGPKIEVVAPAGSKSPVTLQFKFKSYGGSKIDLSTVQVTYLRTPNVDLTARVKPYLTDDGISLKDAELPPGQHILRIDLKDSDGRPTKANVTVKIDP